MMTPTELGVRLKRLREAKGWTQEGLAQRARVARITIARIEGRSRRTKHQRPALRTIERLARALKVEIATLLE